ncbi:MAG: Na+/H+ antiporter NhaA [Alphaproteobacteria bacterium RIFCSPLOWO2_01_FULL_40_26]|nr:MAG: Na+/H+ antiporter NhaA [Alphaproteobacteria bacterium RIFCSPHIGHO2_02_FULL_40_34]OFW85736.1 MAG: Na+/H+ antiporter NhaA [Alphaproteobacteria bacterium RIFCSPHIGHO2_01_FULL_40_8]OFW94175.1 MAG: Na+/H+ antiporter NhaA [Alphaproteobacteria bacterium RIFCSPLOWO2_01_FULL_40_26]OFX09744.1 MAG: Na+/H+ antiporter NhaA [Alphaproteobacteria bacterium RIFCSPLOWO2_02_FULL_40_19]OFX11452.1 MAG: Na+/H+ antiporter NhaA [Alphaproteobacteria bacterium RIFCSPLOWO2_12_FULL_40_11]
MIRAAVKTFFKSEIAIGISLLVATAVALLAANSSEYQTYRDFLAINAPINLGFVAKNLTLLDWINDGLMAIFFLLVGMELKREILIGELSSRHKLALPAIAATGGVIVPLLIFSFFNYHSTENMRGFAVPCATDIAFAYGIISLFGRKISNSLRVFLVALAVLDDLAAILIIAVFYSGTIDANFLFYVAIIIAFLAFLNFKNSNRISLYLIGGAILWLMVLKSGIHATLAGVLTAMFIPMQIRNQPILPKIAHKIAPSVNFLILPVFAFANAGVRIENFSAEIFLQPLVLGIALGLFFGKQIGVMLFGFAAIFFKIAHLPRGTNWLEFYGAAIFTGIGFTMSIFIGSLAFVDNHLMLDETKIGVLLGSLFSILYGSLITFLATKKF